MNGKTVSGIMVTLLLMSALRLAFEAEPIEAQSTPKELTSITVINQTQIWNGDFVVSETDTVIIENCDFTVIEGSILVHGTLDIENCTILIQHETSLSNPEIYVYPNALLDVYNSSIALRGGLPNYVTTKGNLSFWDSELLGYSSVFALQSESHVILKDSTVRALFIGGAGSVVVNGSTLLQVTLDYSGGNVSILNSEVSVTYILRKPADYGCGILQSYFDQSNLTEVKFLFAYDMYANLSLQEGLVSNLNILDQKEGHNLTFSDCFIDKWRVTGQNLTLYDSSIERIGFFVETTQQLNLTLESGLVESKCILIENSVNITVVNSEVDEWYASVRSSNVSISDSFTWVSVSSNTNVDVANSTLLFAGISSSAQNASLHTTNSTANGVWLWYKDSAVNLVLSDGYHNFSTFVDEASGKNLTIEETFVEHWTVGAFGNSTLHLDNSTISSPPYNPDYTRHSRFAQNAKVFFYNSTLNGSVQCRDSASFTMENSSLHELWVVDESCSITLNNSTVDILIIDPPEINLTNSRIYSEIRFSYPTSQLYTPSIMETPPVPLPPAVHSVGKCLHVEGSCYDCNAVQVRIYFDSNDLTTLGISESSLRMFYLEESADDWQTCSIQGINSSENCVWANVTHFSYFAVGGHLLGDANLDGTVDIFDLNLAGKAYGSFLGDPRYDPDVDFNDDGHVDMRDIIVIARNYGKTAL